jgi:hypothetical protein
MTHHRSGGVEHQQHLEDVLAVYYEARANGLVPDRRILLDRFPQLATDLNEFFTFQDQVCRIAEPVRAMIRGRGEDIDARKLPEPTSPPVRSIHPVRRLWRSARGRLRSSHEA